MKRIYKILLFIVSLACLGLSAGILSLFYYMPGVSDAIILFRALFPWLDAALAGYAIFVSLCFAALLLVALFWPVQAGYLVVARDNSTLRFSKQTVESTVRYSFADVDGISSSRVRARIKKEPEKTQIYVKLFLDGPANLVGLTETVRGKIDSSLKSSLGVEAKTIDIQVSELDSGGKKREISPAKPETSGGAEAEDAAKTSRVI